MATHTNNPLIDWGYKWKHRIIDLEVKLFKKFDMNKQLALEGLLHKYSLEFINQGIKYIEGLKEKTRVFKITINKLSGKARKQ